MNFPKIVLCRELPQWITSSDKAAYHPFSNTIFTTGIRYIPHELMHWIACRLGINVIHKWLDKWRENQKIPRSQDPAFEDFLKQEKKEIDAIVDYLDETDRPHWCGRCGRRLQLVRPGKYQCECEWECDYMLCLNLECDKHRAFGITHHLTDTNGKCLCHDDCDKAIVNA